MTMMRRINPEVAFDTLLFGGALALMVFDLYFLAKALFFGNFVPIVPVVAGMLTCGGLLFVLYADYWDRKRSRREHRRLSRVAHQLENPLTALQTDIKNLIAGAEKLPAEARLQLKHMETRTNLLLENVRDVFLMLQSQEGKLAQEVRAYDICALVEEGIRRVKSLAAARNVEILHKRYCPQATVRMDRRLFLIAVQHLLDNAIHYTITPGMVNVVITKGSREARVLVQDRGIGFHDKDQVQAFEPFARGAHAEQYDPDGIGIGLTLSRAIIREFGGDITYHPREKSAGSEFEIRLPLVKG